MAEIQYHLDVVAEWCYAGGGYAVAKEVQLGHREDALLQVEGQPVGGEDGEKCVQVLPVLVCCFPEDTVII